MNSTRMLAALALCFGMVALPPQAAVAQSGKVLTGTWNFVSVNVVDGEKKFEPFGPNVKGLLVLDGKKFSIIVMRNELPKVGTNNRTTATPQEGLSIVQGSLAYFGTYSIDEAEKAIVMKIEASSFPNWTGTEQKRMFQLSGNELTLTNPAGSAGGVATIRLARAQ